MSFGGKVSRRARLFLVFLALVAGLSGCGGKRIRASLPPADEPPPISTVEADDQTAEFESMAADPNADPDARPGLLAAILETAYSQLGVSYRWGGADPETGFDCSGFVHWVFEENGIELPRNSRSQSLVGVPVSRQDLRPGDLLFYARRRGSKQVGHVGIYVGGDRFIHSPRRGLPIREEDAFDAYRSATFVAARRVASDREEEAAPVPPQLVQNEETPRHYIVRQGDYIWALAKRFQVSPFELLKVNGLKKDSILRIGQRLLIP